MPILIPLCWARLRRLIKSRSGGSGDPLSGYKRIFALLLLVVVGIITFITVLLPLPDHHPSSLHLALVMVQIMTRAAQTSYEGPDPFLEPGQAPNLHVAAQLDD